MTNPLQKSTDPYSMLIRRMDELERIAQGALVRPFVIPVLSQDPQVDDPTNIWLFPDGRLRMRHKNPAGTAFITREWVTSAPGSSTSGAAVAPTPTVPATKQDTFLATWSQSYRQSGAQRTDAGVTMLYYGSSGDSFNGRNQSLIGFDYAAIAAALVGSTINGVWLRLLNLHGWYNNGVDIYFGVHAFTSKPTTWSGGGIPASKISKHHFGKPQERTVPLPIEFASRIRDGTGTGVAIEAPSSSKEYYGYAAGFGSGYTVPALIINYTQ